MYVCHPVCVFLSLCVCVCVSPCAGGAPGAKGKNLLIRANEEMIDLGGKECAAVQPWVSNT